MTHQSWPSSSKNTACQRGRGNGNRRRRLTSGTNGGWQSFLEMLSQSMDENQGWLWNSSIPRLRLLHPSRCLGFRSSSCKEVISKSAHTSTTSGKTATTYSKQEILAVLADDIIHLGGEFDGILQNRLCHLFRCSSIERPSVEKQLPHYNPQTPPIHTPCVPLPSHHLGRHICHTTRYTCV